MEQYSKVYDSASSYDHAYHNFVASLKRSAARNTHGGKTQWGLTKFSDLSPAEFKKLYLTAKPQKPRANVKVAHITHKVTDSSFDWRTKGAISPVKDQAQCGSCWAFSTTENLESQWFIQHKEMLILAPQQLVDCDPQSQGCGGGWTYWAWEYLASVHGQELNSSYPYMAVNQPCKFQQTEVAASVKNPAYAYGITPCKSGPCTNQDENKMKAAVTTIGPMSVCVNAQTWNDYQGGVVQGTDCSGDAGGIDHCVQVVGYSWPEDVTQGYWIVRNSWNTNWGNDGYIYLQTGANTCAVADVVTYGLVN